MIQRLSIFIITSIFCSNVLARSVHRQHDPSIPYIQVRASNDIYANLTAQSNSEKEYYLQNSYLRIKTLKKPFEQSNFKKHMLPYGYITYRKSEENVHSSLLKEKNEKVLQEILDGKKRFTDFTVLADDDFNYSNYSGFIVLKYKDYPFVLKLFIEHPHTFIDPLNKGFKASCLFVLNGNTRHLSGFTRIHNLEIAKKALAKDPQYRYYLDFPRKWYWMPEIQPYLSIIWHDEYHKKEEILKLPGIYGIVCDFIETDKKIQKQEIHTLRQISVDVGTYLNNIIDSHVDNFVPEKNSNKIVIIDTEHFPTMVGLDQKMNANGYIQWHLELTGKYLKTAFGRSKQKRIYDQTHI